MRNKYSITNLNGRNCIHNNDSIVLYKKTHIGFSPNIVIFKSNITFSPNIVIFKSNITITILFSVYENRNS